MTAAYFEDHPTDPDKVILRKPKHDFGEPWSPVSIGVDVTKEGAHVIGIYAMPDDTSQVFYSKFHPAPQRTWVGLTDEEVDQFEIWYDEEEERKGWVEPKLIAQYFESKLKEKNA